ncbi:hypothetical protein [Campylobacter felis]|uniref:hypothetical protein n=1 Tax=Campylobacter felis TaxID=2974565 RepID=UPI00256E6924|nr:hypothetical protein [Campylobacter felis]
MNTPRINAGGGGVKPLQSFNLADYLIGQLYAFSQSKDKAEKLKVLLEIISSIENHTAYKLDISSCTRSTQKFDDEDIMKFLLIISITLLFMRIVRHLYKLLISFLTLDTILINT